MTQLSPAAQAVLTAAWNAPEGRDSYRLAAAVALRAAVGQIRASDKGELSDTIEDVLRGAEREHVCGFLLAIATELEAANG